MNAASIEDSNTEYFCSRYKIYSSNSNIGTNTINMYCPAYYVVNESLWPL